MERSIEVGSSPLGFMSGRLPGRRPPDHNDIQGQPECAFLAVGCRNGVEGFLAYVTAWLVWQLQVEPAAGQVFVGPDAGFLADPRLSGADVRQP